MPYQLREPCRKKVEGWLWFWLSAVEVGTGWDGVALARLEDGWSMGMIGRNLLDGRWDVMEMSRDVFVDPQQNKT